MLSNKNFWHIFKNFFGKPLFCEERFLYNNEGTFEKNSRQSAEKIDTGIKTGDSKSDEYKGKFTADMYEWIDPTKMKKKDFESFFDYLAMDAGEHTEGGSFIGMFIDDPRTPSVIRDKFKIFIESTGTYRTNAETDLKESFANLRNDPQMLERLQSAMKTNDTNVYESAKINLSKAFDKHGEAMAENSSRFVNSMKKSAQEKFLKLERFRGSPIIQTLNQNLKNAFDKINSKCSRIPYELSVQKLYDGDKKDKIYEYYLKNLLSDLASNGVIHPDLLKDCYKTSSEQNITSEHEAFENARELYTKGMINEDQIGDYAEASMSGSSEAPETCTTFNINLAEKVLAGLSNNPRAGYSTESEKNSYKLKAYNSALQSITQESYNEYFAQLKEDFKYVDFILSQYDELIDITKEGKKSKNDVKDFLTTFDIDESEAEKIVNDLDYALGEGFDSAIDVVQSMRSTLNISDNDHDLLIEKISGGQQISQNDDLFWTILWNDLLNASNKAYEIATQNEEKEQESGDDEKGAKKGETPLQKLRKMDADAVNAIYTSLNDGEDSLFKMVESELHKKKDIIGKEKYETEINVLQNDIKPSINRARLKHDKLYNEYSNLSKIINEGKGSNADDRRLKSLEGQIQHNAVQVLTIRDGLDNFINQLSPVSKKHRVIYLVSSSVIFQAFTNVKKYTEERWQSKSKMAGHEFAASIAKGLGLTQLASAEESKANQEYNSRVEEWKKGMKTFSKNQIYREMVKNSKNSWFGREHLHAALDMLSEKGGFRINDEVFLNAINYYLPDGEKINIKWFTSPNTSMNSREAILRKISLPLFNDVSFFPNIIKTSGDKITSKTKEVAPEINRMTHSAGERVSSMYKNYYKRAINDEKLDENGQLISGKVVNFSSAIDDADAAFFEESVFFSLVQVTSPDTRLDFFYIIRGFASGLISEERLSQFEDRGAHNQLPWLNPLRGAKMETIRELDKIMMTKDDGSIDQKALEGDFLDSGGGFRPELAERVGRVIRKLSDEPMGKERAKRNSQAMPSMDPDLTREAGAGRIAMTDTINLLKHSGNSGGMKAQQWPLFILGLNHEFYTFGQDYATGNPSKENQNNQVDDLINTLGNFLLVDANQVSKTWIMVDYQGNKVLSLQDNEINGPLRTSSSGLCANDYVKIMRNIAREVMDKVDGGKQIYKTVYDKEKAADYIQKDFIESFEEKMKTPQGRRALTEVVTKYQKNGWIPTYYNANKAGECLSQANNSD